MNPVEHDLSYATVGYFDRKLMESSLTTDDFSGAVEFKSIHCYLRYDFRQPKKAFSMTVNRYVTATPLSLGPCVVK